MGHNKRSCKMAKPAIQSNVHSFINSVSQKFGISEDELVSLWKSSTGPKIGEEPDLKIITGVKAQQKMSSIVCSICKQVGHNKRSCKTTGSSITREDAEKSATEWLGDSPSLMRDWLVSAIMDRKQHRDIGKVLACVAEIHVNKWLSAKSGRPVKTITGESWDGITDDDKNKVRNQIKFRMDVWHFETTRRNSAKNAETNGTGHIAYRKGEFDMVAIFKPSPTFGITGSNIRCIPVSALINPGKPDQLITSIPSAVRKIYDNEAKTLEVIKTIYQTPL